MRYGFRTILCFNLFLPGSERPIMMIDEEFQWERGVIMMEKRWVHGRLWRIFIGIIMG